jgi:hypothetical protein
MNLLKFKKLFLSLTVIMTSMWIAGPVMAERARLMEERSTMKELLKRIDILSEEVENLKDGRGEDSYLSGLAGKVRLGGYGEFDMIDERGKDVRFDPHRLVLFVGADFADWIKLESEIEFEHSGVEPGGGRFDGEIEIEQLHLDFLLHDAFNVRAGVLLIPGSRINLFHEPIFFNSTERPFVDQFLVPSTWMESGFGIYGSLLDKFRYQLYVTQGMDGTALDAKSGIRGGRQNLRRNNNNSLALSGRLSVSPMPGLDGAFSFYTSPSSDDGESNLTLFEFDTKYSMGPFDILGQVALVDIDDPGRLIAQGAKDISEEMWGYFVEGAYHYFPTAWKRGRLSDADGVVFARFSGLDTQAGDLPAGVIDDGRFRRDIWTFGVTFKPIPSIVLKADYQRIEDDSPDAPLNNDKFQLTLGFAF